MAGNDAALAASIHDRVDRDDPALLQDATSLAVLCTSTGRRRVVLGTL